MKYALTSAALAALALAEVHQVQVGPGLSYSPDTVTAAQGDIVSFTFGAGHDVVSGSFDSPCQPSGGIFSGAPNDGDVFSVTINSTDPIWIYCAVPHHCQGGMAMVINPPSGGSNTLDAYKSAAGNTHSSSAPNGVQGGTFGAVSNSGSSSSSAGSASSATAAASSAASSAGSSASATESAAASSGSGAATSAASASATGSHSGNGVGSVVAPLSFVLGAVVGGAALLM